MQLARFLVEAVVLGKQSPNQLAREYPISRSLLFELLARYRRDGPSALEPRTRHRAASRNQVAQTVVDAIATKKVASALMPPVIALCAADRDCASYVKAGRPAYG